MSEKILNDLIGENSHLKKHCGTLEVEVDQLERRIKDLEVEVDKVKHEKTIYQALRDIESSMNTSFENENEKLKEELASYKSKDISKKPIIKEWNPALCPTCNEELSIHLGDAVYKHHYGITICNCGQKLKWD